MRAAIEVKNLSVSYEKNQVLSKIDLTIPLNSRTAIVGANGAGKSTLLKAVLGLIKKDSGEVKILGKDLKDAKLDLAYVPQKDSVNWNFPIRVYDVVKMGRFPYLGSFKKLRAIDKEKIDHAMDEMGIGDLKDRQISKLSGGQKQRVFLARALAQDVDLYILDEPLTGVDIKTEEIIAKEFKNLQAKGKTIISVHHNIYSLNRYFDHLLVLNGGVQYSGPLNVDGIDSQIDKGFRG